MQRWTKKQRVREHQVVNTEEIKSSFEALRERRERIILVIEASSSWEREPRRNQ